MSMKVIYCDSNVFNKISTIFVPVCLSDVYFTKTYFNKILYLSFRLWIMNIDTNQSPESKFEYCKSWCNIYSENNYYSENIMKQA